MKLYLIIATLCAGMISFSQATQVAAQQEKKCESKPINHKLDKILLKASEEGDLQTIEKLFSGKAIPDVNAKTRSGLTALIIASHHGFTDIVQALISASADVNAKAKEGETALIEASMRDHVSTVQALIAAGADIEATNNGGDTALTTAAYCNRADILQTLIAAGANIEVKNNNGYTGLMGAAMYNHLDAVYVLIAAGADPNIRNEKAGNKTAHDYAKDKDAYDKAVAAGLAERKAYLARAKKIIAEEKQLIPDISNIIADYAYGPSPIDLPESEKKEDANKK